MVWIHSESGSHKYPWSSDAIKAHATVCSRGESDPCIPGRADPNKVETELKVSTSHRVHGWDF